MAEQWWYPGSGLTDTSFTNGPTSAGWQPQNFIYGAGITVGGSAGTATKISVRGLNGGVSGTLALKLGLYNSAGSLIAQTTATVTTTPAWVEGAISVAVSPGTYNVMVSGATNQAAYYHSATGNGIGETVAYASAMPASINTTGDETGLLYAVRVYVVEGGGSASILRQMMQHHL